MAMFASLIAPFGGFFASGFKRAFKLKVGRYLHLKRYCCCVKHQLGSLGYKKNRQPFGPLGRIKD